MRTPLPKKTLAARVRGNHLHTYVTLNLHPFRRRTMTIFFPSEPPRPHSLPEGALLVGYQDWGACNITQTLRAAASGVNVIVWCVLRYSTRAPSTRGARARARRAAPRRAVANAPSARRVGTPPQVRAQPRHTGRARRCARRARPRLRRGGGGRARGARPADGPPGVDWGLGRSTPGAAAERRGVVRKLARVE